MRDIIIVVVLILFLSTDGIMASYSMRQRKKRQIERVENEKIKSVLKQAEPLIELITLKKWNGGVKFPREIMERDGFTGRGSPLLSRNKYHGIEQMDKSIERIIKL